MNQLNVSIQQSIIVLTTRGWSRRRVARELGVDRATVGRQLRRAQAEANAATNPTHGSQGDSPSNAATNPAHGSRPGPTSLCQPLATEIETAVQAGLSVQRIYQDLVREHDFRGAYGSVKRFVHRLVQVHELPFRRRRKKGSRLDS